MKVSFWGVRGSISTSGPSTMRYGGNTTCVQVSHDGHHLILDCGTGAHTLGASLLQESQVMKKPVQATFLFSHLHWDHIQGLPLFGPAFVPSTELTLFGGEGLEDALRGQMQGPYFPVAWDDLASRRDCQPLHSGMGFSVGPFNITARSLCHPQGSLGFRIEAAGKSVCFATDTEQRLEDEIDPALMSLAKDVDLLIHDAQYTAAEYRGELGPPRHGWGHSTYVAACAAAEASGAKQLALFHHDPTHDDGLMDALEADARTYFTATRAAREGLSVEL